MGEQTPSALARGRPVVVAIVASSGGLQALSEIVSALPADFPAVTLVVLHLSEGGRGLLPPILGSMTPLPVLEPTGGERLRAGHVYTASPGADLVVGASGRLKLTRPTSPRRLSPSGDALLESLARQRGLRTVAVILTGRDGDGSVGIRKLAAAGGVVVVQDPETAECGDMPREAIATGVVDYVLPLSEIGPQLVNLVKRQGG